MDKELRYFLQQGPTTVKELSRLTGKSTSILYKSLKGDNIITTDSPKGKLFSISAPEANSNGAGSVPEALAAENPAPASAVAPVAAKRGRKASFGGKQLYPDASLLGGDDSPATYQNPRRKNSNGYRSLQLIIDRPGITTDDYVAAGGRLNDLRWDVAHGNVRAE